MLSIPKLSDDNVIVISDTHIPFEKEGYLDFCLQTQRKYKCKRVVHIGDLVDNHAVSYHEHDPDGWSPADEMEEADIHLNEWFKAFPVVSIARGNHDCNFTETEFLTEHGWKNINTYKGEKVANFDIETNLIFFDVPISFIPPHKKGTITIEGYTTKQIVSEGHDVILNGRKVKAKSLINKEIKINDIPTNGFRITNGIPLTDFELSICLWVIFDGTIVLSSPGKKRLQFKLSRKDKIERLRNLLEANRCAYTFRKATKSGCNILQPYYITIYGEFARKICGYLENVKQIPRYFTEANYRQTQIIIDIISQTDGRYIGNRLELCSISKNNIDILQEIFCSNGITSYYKTKENASGFLNGKLQYCLNVCIKTDTRVPVYIYSSGEREVFCFQMPRGTMITRLNGKLAFTGNCLIDRKGKTVGLPSRAFLQFRDIWRLPNNWKDDFHFIIHDVLYTHGTGYTGKMAHLTAATSNMQSTVIGHLHSSPGVAWYANESKCIFGMNVGCGIDRKAYAFNYGKDFKAKPIVGCGIVQDRGRHAMFVPMEL